MAALTLLDRGVVWGWEEYMLRPGSLGDMADPFGGWTLTRHQDPAGGAGQITAGQMSLLDFVQTKECGRASGGLTQCRKQRSRVGCSQLGHRHTQGPSPPPGGFTAPLPMGTLRPRGADSSSALTALRWLCPGAGPLAGAAL